MRLKEEGIDKGTRFDIRMSGRMWQQVKGTAKLALVDHLRWEIDRELGKIGCLIEFETPEITVNFVPTHEFCDKFLDWMFESEWLNDQFKFKDPVINEKRAPQLLDKIEKVIDIINKWQEKASNQETKKLSEFMR